jgi:hypothetical protein
MVNGGEGREGGRVGGRERCEGMPGGLLFIGRKQIGTR